jgi:hypothetical protein
MSLLLLLLLFLSDSEEFGQDTHYLILLSKKLHSNRDFPVVVPPPTCSHKKSHKDQERAQDKEALSPSYSLGQRQTHVVFFLLHLPVVVSM